MLGQGVTEGTTTQSTTAHSYHKMRSGPEIVNVFFRWRRIFRSHLGLKFSVIKVHVQNNG